MKSQFVFATCQVGAEATIKKEVQATGWRIAFSRPGFLTFKLPMEQNLFDDIKLPSLFVRSYGMSLGAVQGASAEHRAREVWQRVAEIPLDHLHVWPRDPVVAGYRGFEPRLTDESIATERVLCGEAPPCRDRLVATRNARLLARRDEHVLDCILVESGQWWMGVHRVNRWIQRWPGGIWSNRRPLQMVSRGYLKMSEALDWACWPMKPGQRCVELGCAPGGASQALLERGLRVVGIDPANVDPRVIANQNFKHVRKRSYEVRRRDFREFQWLVIDMNVPPTSTLSAVEEIVCHRTNRIWGMILNLKLQDWNLAEQIPEYLERIRSWGYPRIRARQLSKNRQEICVAALRPPRRTGKSRRARVLSRWRSQNNDLLE